VVTCLRRMDTVCWWIRVTPLYLGYSVSCPLTPSMQSWSRMVIRIIVLT
jgi:hypothetical protein